MGDEALISNLQALAAILRRASNIAEEAAEAARQRSVSEGIGAATSLGPEIAAADAVYKAVMALHRRERQ